jgi:hypothetical protein
MENENHADSVPMGFMNCLSYSLPLGSLDVIRILKDHILSNHLERANNGRRHIKTHLSDALGRLCSVLMILYDYWLIWISWLYQWMYLYWENRNVITVCYNQKSTEITLLYAIFDLGLFPKPRHMVISSQCNNSSNNYREITLNSNSENVYKCFNKACWKLMKSI